MHGDGDAARLKKSTHHNSPHLQAFSFGGAQPAASTPFNLAKTTSTPQLGLSGATPGTGKGWRTRGSWRAKKEEEGRADEDAQRNHDFNLHPLSFSISPGLFGGAPPATPATGFGGFGGGGGLFGGGGVSGAPPATPSLFGATPPAPGFGGGGLFGAAPPPQAPTPGLFATPTPAPGGGLFGGGGGGGFGLASTAPAPAPGGLFGFVPAAPAAPPTFQQPSLFSAPAAAGGLFGAAPTPYPQFGGAAPAMGGGLFGGYGAAAQPAPAEVTAAVRELEGLREAFSAAAAPAPVAGAPAAPASYPQPHQPGGLGAAAVSAPFTALMLNVVADPAARVRPAGVDELKWREALGRAGVALPPGSEFGGGSAAGTPGGMLEVATTASPAHNNPPLWPVPVPGFPALLARRAAQRAALDEASARAAAAADAAAGLARRQAAVVSERLAAARRTQAALAARLLSVCRHVDALEARYAGVGVGGGGGMGADRVAAAARASRSLVASLSSDLARAEAVVAPGAAGGLEGRAAGLAAAARLRAGGSGSCMPGGGDGCAGPAAAHGGGLDAAALRDAYAVLSEQGAAVARIRGVLGRDARDVQLVEEAYGGGE